MAAVEGSPKRSPLLEVEGTPKRSPLMGVEGRLDRLAATVDSLLRD
jgi:hypothetical protein